LRCTVPPLPALVDLASLVASGDQRFARSARWRAQSWPGLGLAALIPTTIVPAVPRRSVLARFHLAGQDPTLALDERAALKGLFDQAALLKVVETAAHAATRPLNPIAAADAPPFQLRVPLDDLPPRGTRRSHARKPWIASSRTCRLSPQTSAAESHRCSTRGTTCG